MQCQIEGEQRQGVIAAQYVRNKTTVSFTHGLVDGAGLAIALCPIQIHANAHQSSGALLELPGHEVRIAD